MPTTLEEAYATITDHLIAQWASRATAVVNPAPELRFTGRESGTIPKATFARFTMNPVLERQATMRNGVDQRYTSSGNIILQIMSLRTDPDAEGVKRRLASVGKAIFRGQSLAGCIWFRNMRINNLDPEANFLRANVIGEYEYDEIG